jgi:general secretion pathway protein D
MINRGRSAGLMAGTVALAMGVGFSVICPVACAAQDGARETLAGQAVIPQVNIVDADLSSAVNILKTTYGIDVILEPSADKPYGRVNVSLTNKSVDLVLKSIARTAGASVRIEDGVYVVGPISAAPKPKPEVVQPVNPPAERTAPVRSRVERIRLQNTRPSEIKNIIYGSASEMLINGIEQQLYANAVGDPTRSKPQELGAPRMPSILFGNENGSQAVPPVVPTDRTPISPAPGNGQTGPEGQRGGGLGGGRGGGGLGGLGGGGLGGGGLGGGGLGGGGLGGGGLGGGQGAGGAANLLPEGIQSVTAYDVDNTLIVRYDTDDALRELKEIVRLLDIAPKQLSIKAEFIQVQQDDLRSFGIDFTVQRGALNATTGQSASGEVQVNFASGNLVAALRASLVEGRGRIVNAPMATTTNNVPVTLTVSTTVPVITNSVAFGNNGQGITVPNITLFPVSSGLFVVPRINGDNSITMLAIPFVQDILSEVANPAGGTIPIITSQFVPVTRRIGNNETMVIGGLIKKNDRTSTKRVPLFGDLPLIGSLFRSTTTTISDSELLVFITPTILPDPVSQAAPGGASTQLRP